MQVHWKRSALVAGAIGAAVIAGVAWNLGAGRAFADENEREFTGLVEARPVTDVGVWRIAGQNVVVTVETEIDHNGQALGPGTRVEVEGTAQPDGSILAKEIEVGPDGDDNDNASAFGNSQDDDDDGGPSAHDDNDNAVAPGSPPANYNRDDDDGPKTPRAVGTQRDDDD